MKLKKRQNKLMFFLITYLIIYSLTIFAFAAEENIEEQLGQLRNILDSSSAYSAFQTTMLLKSAQSLLESGVLFESTREIIENSIEKSFNAYSIKEVFDVLLETKNIGFSVTGQKRI